MTTKSAEPLAARLKPGIAIPPGETLVEELEVRGMSQSELARRAGRPVQAINEIARGKKEITAETALAFEHVLGTSAEFWMRLEADYRLARARERATEPSWISRKPTMPAGKTKVPMKTIGSSFCGNAHMNRNEEQRVAASRKKSTRRNSPRR